MFTKRIRKSRGKIFDACLICARSCFNDGRFDIARILLEKAIKYKKNDLRAYFLLAEIYEKEGKRAEALNIYKEIMVISEWQTKDENFQRASKKIYCLTNPTFHSLD